jgi:hypothetical protein
MTPRAIAPTSRQVVCVCGDEKEVTHMVRWQIRYIRATIALAGFAALLVDAGAGLRWK